MKELNALESRRGRRPLDVNNVIYWFKNTRAAVKRAEMKARVTTTSMTSTLTSGSGCEKVASSGNIFGSSPPSAHNSLWPWFHNARTRFEKIECIKNFSSKTNLIAKLIGEVVQFQNSRAFLIFKNVF